ncbi:hypothetical protein VXP97_12815 [Acinetobacter sp. 207]
MVDFFSVFIKKEETIMSKSAPDKFFAPIVIAGITIGFFVAAYKFVFAKPEATAKPTENVEKNHPKEDRPSS